MIVAVSLTEDEQRRLLGQQHLSRDNFLIAGKIRKARCEEGAWEDILTDEEKLIASLASRRICPTCLREFKVRVNGKLRLHRSPHGKACAGDPEDRRGL